MSSEFLNLIMTCHTYTYYVYTTTSPEFLFAQIIKLDLQIELQKEEQQQQYRKEAILQTKQQRAEVFKFKTWVRNQDFHRYQGLIEGLSTDHSEFQV